MPVSTSNIVFLGTDGGATLYRRKGRFLCRKKSSLTAERVKGDPAFAGFRKSSNRMGEASRLGAVLYSQLPQDLKEHTRYREFTGEAFLLLKQGMQGDEILRVLQARFIDPLLQQPLRKQSGLRLEVNDDYRSTFAGKQLMHTYRKFANTRRIRQRELAAIAETTEHSRFDRQAPFISMLRRPRKPLEKPVKSSKHPPGLIYLGRLSPYRKLRIYQREQEDQFLIGYYSFSLKHLPPRLQEMIETVKTAKCSINPAK